MAWPGCEVTPSHFRVDFLIKDDDRRVAITCPGPQEGFLTTTAKPTDPGGIKGEMATRLKHHNSNSNNNENNSNGKNKNSDNKIIIIGPGANHENVSHGWPRSLQFIYIFSYTYVRTQPRSSSIFILLPAVSTSTTDSASGVRSPQRTRVGNAAKSPFAFSNEPPCPRGLLLACGSWQCIRRPHQQW